MKLTPDILTAALEGLQAQRALLEGQIANIRRMLGTRRGRPPQRQAEGALAPVRRKRRKLSAAARRRMSDAQKKRWAAIHAGKAGKRK